MVDTFKILKYYFLSWKCLHSIKLALSQPQSQDVTFRYPMMQLQEEGNSEPVTLGEDAIGTVKGFLGWHIMT